MRKSIHTGILVALALAAAVPVAAARMHNSYILLAQGKRWATMSGSTDDIGRARALRSGDEGLLYVRHEGRAYVIRDAATLARAQAILAPQAELGRRQGELGARQGALGARQGALGAEQARLGVQQISASPREQEALGRQQDELGRRQDELGKQQDVLGRRQDALGREQDRVSQEADIKMGALIEQAVRSGTAKRAD